ncbi:MAG: hypothetical protein HY673_04390 [Chloroflexi bacterium]|nr:hypothetical protein [Chloroflexota bacterium]
MVMATQKQKLSKTDRELERRLAALKALRDVRRQICQAHGSFPEIDELIREMRERDGKPAYE